MNVVNVAENDLAILVVVLGVLEPPAHHLVRQSVYVRPCIVYHQFHRPLMLVRGKFPDLTEHLLIVDVPRSHDARHGLAGPPEAAACCLVEEGEAWEATLGPESRHLREVGVGDSRREDVQKWVALASLVIVIQKHPIVLAYADSLPCELC